MFVSNTGKKTMNKQKSTEWQWQEWSGLSYLTCNLLQDWQHGFFTQAFYPRLPEALISVLNPEAVVYRVKQVHGNVVLNPTEIITVPKDKEASLPNADGVITDDARQGGWVASADYNPVLIGDRATGQVAAIHAGWRGTAQRIVPEAIKRFLDCGSNLENLLVAIGPAIAGEVYQVSENVASEVVRSIIDLEENPLEVMSLKEAQARDLWLLLGSIDLITPKDLASKVSLVNEYCTQAPSDVLPRIEQLTKSIRPFRRLISWTRTQWLGRDVSGPYWATLALETYFRGKMNLSLS